MLSINKKARRRISFLSSSFTTPSHRRRDGGPSFPPLSPGSPRLPRVLGDRPSAPLAVGTIRWLPTPLRSPSEARPLHRINHVSAAPQTQRDTRTHEHQRYQRARRENIYAQTDEFPFLDARDNSPSILCLSCPLTNYVRVRARCVGRSRAYLIRAPMAVPPDEGGGSKRRYTLASRDEILRA